MLRVKQRRTYAFTYVFLPFPSPPSRDILYCHCVVAARTQIFDRGTLGRKQTPAGYYGSAIIGRVNLQVAARLYYILRYITLGMLYAYSARAHR